MRFDPNVLADLEARVRAIPASRVTRLIGIDGRGGSGKSTLARDLARLLRDTRIVEFDDFYRPAWERTQRVVRGDDEIGGDFDWRKVRDQVLTPLANGTAANYQRYDWDNDELSEWHTIPANGTVIVEGNYATRPELRGYYNLAIWVAAPHHLRLQRGIERDGEHARERWLNEWMPEEDRYITAHRPADHADIVIDGGTPRQE
jgi:uridine kinase